MNRNDKSFHYVYLTENKINGKKYIGQHSTDNMDDGYIGSGRKLLKEIKKYGKKNFTKKILEYSDNADELDSLEKNYIKKYNSLAPNGYNLTRGGESKKEYSEESIRTMSQKAKGRKISEETRKRMAEASRGRIHSVESKRKISVKLKGRVFSEETRKKMSESHKGTSKPWAKGGSGIPLYGEKNGMFGKKHKEETKKRISEKTSEGLKGRVFTEDHKINLRKARKGIPSFQKGIGHKQRFINIYIKYKVPLI